MTERFTLILKDGDVYITDTKGLKTLTDFENELKEEYRDNGIGYCISTVQEIAKDNYYNYLCENGMTAEEVVNNLNRYWILYNAVHRDWQKVIDIINEEIERTDNSEIKQFLTELLRRELPE